MTLSIGRDRRFARCGTWCHRFLCVRISAPLATGDRPTVNLSFVVDRSGSMSGDKIRLAKEAVRASLAMLDPRDRFSIVAYDTEVDVVHPASVASTSARSGAIEALSGVAPRGATDLAAGWLTGCGQVALGLETGQVGRCLLLTDGLANHGIRDLNELRKHASELRARAVSTSTFGVGADFDEELLGNLADSGGGNFYFIETADQIAAFLANELGEALTVVARDVVLQVSAPPRCDLQVIGPYPLSRTDRGFRVQLPDLVSAQELEIVLRLSLPAGQVGTRAPLLVSLADREGVLTASAPVDWEYADDAANDTQPRDRAVDRAVAAQYAALARRDATQLNRKGAYHEAFERIDRVARKIAGYSRNDPVLTELVQALRREAAEMRDPQDSSALKSRYFISSSAIRGKESDGTSRRR